VPAFYREIAVQACPDVAGSDVAGPDAN